MICFHQKIIFQIFVSLFLVLFTACSMESKTQKIMDEVAKKMNETNPEFQKAIDEQKRREKLPPPGDFDEYGLAEIEDGLKYGTVFYKGYTLEDVDYEVHVLKFEKGKFQASIIPTGDDANNYLSPEELRKKLNAKMVINGGYFSDSAKPNIQEGLLILDGKKITDITTNPKLSGVLTIQENAFNILETSQFKIENLSADASAIQSGPRLVEHGSVNGIQKPDLTNTNDSREMRTAICIQSNGDVLFLINDPKKSGLYLYEMAEVAISQGCDIALNLDGGPASSISLKKYENSSYDVALEFPAQKGWVHPNLIVIE